MYNNNNNNGIHSKICAKIIWTVKSRKQSKFTCVTTQLRHVHKISLQVIWIFRVGRVSERAFRPATCRPTCWSTVDMSPDVLERFRQRQNLVRPAHRHDGVIQFSDWLNANVPLKCAVACVSSVNDSTEKYGIILWDTCSRMCAQILGHVCWLMLRVAGVNSLIEQRGKRHVARHVSRFQQVRQAGLVRLRLVQCCTQDQL